MVGTMALIIVLSVFNGFESLVKSLFNSFDPDLKITLAEGKNFDSADLDRNAIEKIPGVISYVEVLEETALLKYQNRQALVTLKGVGEDFRKSSGLDTMMINGSLLFEKGDYDYLVLGYGVAYMLGSNLNDYETPISVYAPRRNATYGPLAEQAFNSRVAFPSGIFSIQHDFDTKYTLTSLRFARDLFQYNEELTAVELGTDKRSSPEIIKKQVKELVGERFVVKDRYEQQALLYKIMKSEKLAIFFILSFILFVATFNILGTLSMLILDKKKDIAVLHSFGADKNLIRKIFYSEGLLISLSGAIMGMILGAIICLVQIKFGIVPLSGGEGAFVVDAYPVKLQLSDFVLVFLMVMVISIPAAWLPAHRITSNFFNLRLS